MIQNYFRTALRFLLKNKTFSFINIIGLAMGTLCCLYILLYVEEQYSYDKHEDHAGDIYRVITTMKLLGDHHQMATVSPPIAAGLKREFPEVQQYTRVFNPSIFGADQHLLKYKDRSFYEKEALFVDSTFFELFTYHFLRGNPSLAMAEPYSIVLTAATADKLFGREDPMGKIIRINNKAGEEDLKVTGIIDEVLGRSHIKANVFITMNSGLIGRIVNRTDTWAGSNFIYSYVKLRSGTNPQGLEKKLPPFLNRYGQQQLKAIGMEKQLHLQPIRTIHTTMDYEVELNKPISPSFLSILLLIALLIQVIACINFMNLSTARASQRAKEVGVRKVIGAGRSDLIRQFLGESLLLSLVGVLLALPLLVFLLPYLNQVTRADIQLSFFRDYRLWLVLLALVSCTGLLAGSYPAFYLSAFQAINVIKGNFTSRVSAVGLRRSLVVFQFTLSIILISGIVSIYSQLNYIKNKDLGFEKGQKLIFNIYTDGVNTSRLLADLRLLPEVKGATKSNSQLGKPILSDRGIYLAGGNAANALDANIMLSDKYFAQAAGLRFLSGRDFHDFDSGKVIINETLAQKLRLNPATAQGTKLYSRGDDSVLTYEVVGIVKDFHFSSLHETVKPYMLICDPNSPSLCTLMINCNTGNYKDLLTKIASVWQKEAPGVPFEYSFLDKEVQKQYETEITLSNIINCFTGMAILISCLGLFGLAAFSAEQRSKEIGVRKVLGASVSGIVQLLSADFLKLVGVALLISIPISWWAMHKWLQGFAYRVDLHWWMFALSGLLAIVIALLTVSFHTIKAATVNPVKSLRTE
ncbi:MAG TPA: ABC transporter permease [Puia sp.]|nr:ABC transporter permease [Puia sp.]